MAFYFFVCYLTSALPAILFVSANVWHQLVLVVAVVRLQSACKASSVDGDGGIPQPRLPQSVTCLVALGKENVHCVTKCQSSHIAQSIAGKLLTVQSRGVDFLLVLDEDNDSIPP